MKDKLGGTPRPYPNDFLLGDMVKTGIFLKIVEEKTGKEVHYGVQLNSTTQEIEALPGLIVSIGADDNFYIPKL